MENKAITELLCSLIVPSSSVNTLNTEMHALNKVRLLIFLLIGLTD